MSPDGVLIWREIIGDRVRFSTRDLMPEFLKSEFGPNLTSGTEESRRKELGWILRDLEGENLGGFTVIRHDGKINGANAYRIIAWDTYRNIVARSLANRSVPKMTRTQQIELMRNTLHRVMACKSLADARESAQDALRKLGASAVARPGLRDPVEGAPTDLSKVKV